MPFGCLCTLIGTNGNKTRYIKNRAALDNRAALFFLPYLKMLKNVKYFKNIWISQLSILKRFKAVLLKIGISYPPQQRKCPKTHYFMFVGNTTKSEHNVCISANNIYIYHSTKRKNIILYLSYFQILINYFADFSKIIAKMFGSLNPLPYLCIVQRNNGSPTD